jgi:tetratricopeptide (TPR) repeat protein
VQTAGGRSIGAEAIVEAAAQRAHDLGLPGVAADLYREALAGSPTNRNALTLALATALLDAGQVDEAEKALAEIPEPRGSDWHLRVGLAATQRRRFDVARAELAGIREAELSVYDLPWFWFLQGELTLASTGEFARAKEYYAKAEEGARTDLAKARFGLAAEKLRLRLSAPPGADLKATRENYEKYQGTPVGYGFAQNLAVGLDAIGQKGQAVTFLQGVLIALPRRDRVWWDRLRLVLGIVGDKSRNGAGRNALGQVLETGSDAVLQRQALQILAAESAAEPERGHFRGLLTKLIAQTPDHPVKEALLYFRAQLALVEKEFGVAEEDANALLKQFPLSPLKAHALGVLTQSAWEQRRFRLAADFAQKTRAELRGTAAGVTVPGVSPGARAQVQLGILEAEAWFRAGLAAGDRSDFRSAADAYATVLRERPAGLAEGRVGGLMLQRVLAEIKAGAAEAGKVLDEYALDPAFDPGSRWQAEWSLARALQLRGAAGVKEAYDRVNYLLQGGAPPGSQIKPELRARMAWLQARLSFEGGDLERTIELVERLLVEPLEVEPKLRGEIASTAVLLRVRAEFSLGREGPAGETLRKLRVGYPGSDAAASSFLIEAEQYVVKDKIDEARKALINLTDSADYRNSEYVPFALLELASLAERLGRPENLQEANKRLEELVVHPAATGQADLVFAARLKQGDVFRKLNDFAAAQRAYEDLVNRYPRRPDVVLAQLALAATHNAQSSSRDPSAAEPSHADSAMLIFEQLRDRVDAPRDVRVEAGFNLGLLLARRGKPEEAVKVWWRDVVHPFLEVEARPFESDAKRPYFLARTLRELGDLLEKLGRPDEAKRAYRLLLDQRLPYGEAVARARLEQLGVVPPRK